MFQALSSENFTPAGNHKVMSGGNKKMVALDVCNDFVVYAVSTYGCSQGNHMPGDDACAWNNGGTVPDGEYRAGYTYTAVTVQVCHTVNYPDPEGGGNSGGGGTTPNPPGDYDPCKDAVPTAAYVNNSSGLKLAVVAPSPCDEGGGGKLPIIDDETPSQFAIELQLFINELQISDALLVSFLANNKNVFNTLNNYHITNGKTVENKEFVKWAIKYLFEFPDADIDELIAINDVPNSNINLPILDTSELNNYPAFKALVEDLPNFLNSYPNILTALENTTGLTTTKIKQLMQPGKGPKVVVINNLKSTNGYDILGQYDDQNKILRIDKDYVSDLSKANTPIKYKGVGLILIITTLHEFVHYGRDINNLPERMAGLKTGKGSFEAGVYFEDMIIPPGASPLEPATAHGWLRYYNIKYKE